MREAGQCATDEHDVQILVADDSRVYQKLIENALSQEQCSLLFAKSGRDALQILAKNHPALVITDWVMPDVTGIELCRHIRSNHEKLYTYIILLTSVSEKEQVVTGLAAGADDYLTKPFHPGELVARVRVGCRIVALHRQLQANNLLLEELALTDSLTGLPNRRAMEVWAVRELGAAARYGFAFWVVIADLDHFKDVNDRYGHEAGDIVLKKFADILKANTRQSNISCRLGGEEFLLALTHIEKENVRLLVERIRGHLERESFVFGSHSIAVTASFGVSGFGGRKAPELGRLVSLADSALYNAKQQGRNRIEFAGVVVS